MKKIGIHILTHIAKYQLTIIGILALIWIMCPENDRLEPLIAFITVVFAAFALKRTILKGNVDEDIMKIISRSHPVNDWHNNEVFSENEHIAVYRKEPTIKIVRNREAVNNDFKEIWLLNLYPDQRTQSYNVSVQFNSNELLKRMVLLVDGGRAYIPVPKSSQMLETNEFDLALCQVLNGSSAYDTAYYFRQSKMKVVDNIVQKT